MGDISVSIGDYLQIQPGVTVLFTGNYKFTVNGLLTAEGTENDSITFSRMYPTEESKWRGFRFDSADDSSTLSRCIIEYAKGTGAYPDVRGGAIWINNCTPLVSNCTIQNSYTHNENYNGAGGGVCINSNSHSIIEYNYIINTQADSGGGYSLGRIVMQLSGIIELRVITLSMPGVDYMFQQTDLGKYMETFSKPIIVPVDGAVVQSICGVLPGCTVHILMSTII